MKIIFKDELTYLDLLLPVLKIIKDNNIDKFLLFSKISKLDDFSKYDEDSIIKQVKKTLFYLKEVNYITYTNKLIRLTQKGVDHLSNLNKQENKIKKDINITSDERNEQLKKIERRYTNKINRELIKKYDIPDFPTLQQDLLAYIRDATYHIPTRKEMIINFIKSHHYTKEQIGILTMGIKEIMINSRAHVAIGDLKFLNLIEENENHEFYITKKGLKYVDNPELIKTINPTIHEFYINRKKEKNHETTSDSYDLKYDLSDELTYIDLLLVVLESINKSSETLKSLTDSIIKTNQFIEFDNDKIQKQVKITVKYLQKTEYVDIISDEIIITEKGINIVDNFNKEIDEIKSDNYQQDDKDEALLKKEEQYIRKINKNIQDT